MGKMRLFTKKDLKKFNEKLDIIERPSELEAKFVNVGEIVKSNLQPIKNKNDVPFATVTNIDKKNGIVTLSLRGGRKAFGVDVGAVKFDDNKPKMHLLPSKAILGIAEAMTYGAKKYKSYNYKTGDGLDHDRPVDAALRHIFQWLDGEDIDQESGVHHLKCAGAGICMALDLIGNGIGKDTRFKK